MNPQEFLKGKIEQAMKMGALMATPGPAPVKMLTQLKGSTPTEGEWNPGPLIKVGNPFAGEDLINIRDTRQYYDPELGGVYGPGA